MDSAACGRSGGSLSDQRLIRLGFPRWLCLGVRGVAKHGMPLMSAMESRVENRRSGFGLPLGQATCRPRWKTHHKRPVGTRKIMKLSCSLLILVTAVFPLLLE